MKGSMKLTLSLLQRDPHIALADIMFPRHITFFHLKRQPRAHSSLKDFPF